MESQVLSDLQAFNNAMKSNEGFGLFFVVGEKEGHLPFCLEFIEKQEKSFSCFQLDSTWKEGNIIRCFRQIQENNPSLDGVCFLGIFDFVDKEGFTPFVANLNAARNSLAKIPLSLILFLTADSLANIHSNAPDFFSIRSFTLFLEPSEEVVFLEEPSYE